MRNLLLAATLAVTTSIGAVGWAQAPAPPAAKAPDPLAIGGKDTAWFMDRISRPDLDSQPQAPFKLAGNVYYIGANNIASILIATPKGLVLIDTGTQKMASVVFPNMVKLGFKPADIKLMLISHAHYDHMETMETIRRLTGATVAALEPELPALTSGHDLGPNETWGQEPLEVGRILQSGDDIELGGTHITVVWTPGHTRGAATYFINTVENGKPVQVVFGGPPNPNTGSAKYDTRPADAFASYAALRQMHPDILITGHPGNLLKGKLEALWAGKGPSPLTLAPGQWEKMINDSEANFRRKLATGETSGGGGD